MSDPPHTTMPAATGSAALLFEVTDLKQWAYCPRVLYYRYCLPEIRPITDLITAGIASHRDEGTREERRSLRTYGLTVGERIFDIGLRSAALGLRGRLDLAIAVPSRAAPAAEAIVVEYKDSEKPAGPHFKLQLAAYALLLERRGACRCGAASSTAFHYVSRKSSPSRRRCGRKYGRP